MRVIDLMRPRQNDLANTDDASAVAEPLLTEMLYAVTK
jgi:hypothetical protein